MTKWSLSWMCTVRDDAVVTQASLTAAVITASVAVFVAVVAQISTWSLEHRNRVYERRRAALLDLQDAALAVRSSLLILGQELRTAATESPLGSDVSLPEDPRAARARADADALLSVRQARVESAAVQVALERWHQAARLAGFGAGDDVTAVDVEAAWADMNDLIGEELSVPGWWQRRRRRARSAR